MNRDEKQLRRNFEPKSLNQSKYIDYMKEYGMVFCSGPAGSGKTACAVGYGVHQFYEGQFDRIIITRPAVGVDEYNSKKSLGFLPGGIDDKMGPFIKPVMDELRKYFYYERLKYLMEIEDIEILPLYYTRGRNFHQSFIICDEGQNASYNELLALTTRLGRTSKLVVTGDLQQHDALEIESGMEVYIKEIAEHVEDIAICELEEIDIVRHKLVRDIVRQDKVYKEKLKKQPRKLVRNNYPTSNDYGNLFK